MLANHAIARDDPFVWRAGYPPACLLISFLQTKLNAQSPRPA